MDAAIRARSPSEIQRQLLNLASSFAPSFQQDAAYIWLTYHMSCKSPYWDGRR
ncbi:unnamed protein product [Penicillium roqueforti FM164]|uniref:Genomic scaffold, ProqFM164S02 n=1 Tax=Penicillium roqueforti (strain FM164) TaxID=1365484 RepID=W6Q7Q7_PENRF|nr:unnamed protein product [Penicillium roqueforti FM164]